MLKANGKNAVKKGEVIFQEGEELSQKVDAKLICIRLRSFLSIQIAPFDKNFTAACN